MSISKHELEAAYVSQLCSRLQNNPQLISKISPPGMPEFLACAIILLWSIFGWFVIHVTAGLNLPYLAMAIVFSFHPAQGIVDDGSEVFVSCIPNGKLQATIRFQAIFAQPNVVRIRKLTPITRQIGQANGFGF